MDFKNFQKEYLDVVLVPSGLLIMLIYHLFLLYKYLKHPLSTAMGYENKDKKTWVGKILQVKFHIYFISSSSWSNKLVDPNLLTVLVAAGSR